ncbi:MAG TPA: hypothetical protein VNZ86_19215 [Bacteroidia bacterium]|jgi:hypothetical protein|nr:hypothetical protein [Bacteroidia bacterium]
MKKIVQSLSGFLMLCFILSCSQPGTENSEKGKNNNPDRTSEGLKIETKDVKGIIQAGEHARAGVGTLVNEEGTFEEATVNFEHKAGLNIYPSKQPFDTLVHQLKDKLRIWGSFDVVEMNDHSFYYKTTREFGGQKEEGYNFLMMIQGKKHTYIISGEGENPLKPIAEKQWGDKIYHIAQTFVPAD